MIPKRSIHFHLLLRSVCSLAAVLANQASATILFWSGNGAIAGGSGAWDTGSSRWSVAPAGPFLSNWNNANLDTATFGGNAAGTVTLGTAITVGGLQMDTAGYVITGNTLTFGSAGSIAANQAATISSTLAGSVAITKTGVGTLTLNGTVATTFNGGLNLNGGTLLADFASLPTPTDLINSGNALGFGGGILSIKGKSSDTTSQTLGNVTVNAGGGQILGNKNSGTSTTIKLGSITATATGGSLLVGSGGTSPIITTTTNKDAAGIYGGRIVFFNGTANTGYDFVTTVSGASPYTLSAYAGYTALPTSGGVSGTNYNLTASLALTGGFSVNTLKFAPAAVASQTLDLGANTLTAEGGGILITGTGASTAISNGTLTAGNGSGSYDLIVHQFNSAGGITNTQTGNNTTISAVISNNGGNSVSLVKSGSGSLALTGACTYSGNTYINGGNLLIGNGGSSGVLGSGGTYAGNISIVAGANLCFYNSAGTQTLSGVISGEGSLVKAYNSTLVLSNSNTYSGKTTLSMVTTNGGGTLSVSSFNSVNGGNPPLASSSLGRPVIATNGIIDFGGGAQAGGTLKYTGTGETTDRAIKFIFNGNGAGKTIDASGTGNLKFTSAFTSNNLISNDMILTGSGGGEIAKGLPFGFRNFTKSGTGTWTFGDSVNTADSAGIATISSGTLVIRKGGLSNTGLVTVSANANLTHYAATDAPLNISGSLTINGGTSTTLGASIGAATDSALINVVGIATTTAAAVKVNLYGNNFSTLSSSSDTYTLIQGGGASTLNNATYSLGTVYNATTFTVGALGKTAAAVTVGITQVPALVTAYWKGTATSTLTKVWAASNGSNDSNWSSTAGGAVQSLVPGADTDVFLPATSPAITPTNTILGGDLSIKSLTIADTANGLGLIAASKDSYKLSVGTGGITMNGSVPASAIGAPVVLAASQTWTNNSANTLTVSGPIGGSGNLEKGGTGTVTLSGTNTYTGNTTVQSGTLALSQPTLDVGSTVTVAGGGALQLNFTGTNAISRLVLNGVVQSGGVYNSTNAAPYITGTGSLKVIIVDSDVDGIPDWWTQLYFGHASGTPGDLSRASDDADADGISNLQEFLVGSNPKIVDTDGDGLGDGYEVNTAHSNPLLTDTDSDTLSDAYEVNTSQTSPILADTDSDSLSDGYEVNTSLTNPLLADTDGDGAGDWYEAYASFTNPNLASSKPNIPYPLPRPDNTPPATNKPVKVFILSGQSNMEGKGDINPINTPGTLATIVKQKNEFPNLLDVNGNWSVRGDVKYRGVGSAIGNASLTVGQGYSSTLIGPELGFGHVMGYYLNEPVIVIKASLGGQDLGYDFLTPGSQRYTVGGMTYGGYLDTARKWTEGTTPPPQYVPGTPSGYFGNPVGGANNYGGKMYDDCVSSINAILSNFSTQYPQYASQGYQIAGIGWFQGFNDTVTTTFPERYENNLVNFIKAYRTALNAPNAPFVVATCGFDGFNAANSTLTVINAQLAVSDPVKHPEFAGNVKSMDCRGYWRDVAASPISQGYHYNHNSETYMLVGDALGRGMIDLLAAGTAGDYSTWKALYPTANLSDPNADLDGDGLTNDRERAFGLDPTSGASANPISIPLNATTGTFSYTRRNSSLTGLTYTVWTSNNLSAWTADNGAAQTPGTVDSNGTQSVSVTLSPGLLTAPKLFVQVRASNGM